MTDTEIAEKILNDTMSLANKHGGASNLFPISLFTAATHYLTQKLMSDDDVMKSNRRLMNIRRIMDEKIELRHQLRNSLITPPKGS